MHTRNPLLHGVRLRDVANALDRDDMLAVHTDQRRQASIDRGMVDLFSGWVVLREDLSGSAPASHSHDATATYHSAGPAATLSAPKLGACQADAAQVLEQRDLGVDRVQHDAGAVEVEDDSILPVGDDSRQSSRRVLGDGGGGDAGDIGRHE